MNDISVQLSSIKCGLCESFLLYPISINNIDKYTCRCGLKVRAVLVCRNCKKHFLNFPYLVRKTNYCSLKCYWTGTDRKQLRVCKICKKEFYAKANLIKKGFGFYCNMRCWFSLFAQQRKTIKCKECGKERSVYRSVYVKHPKFCSNKCRDDFKRNLVSRVCRGCKIEFQIPGYLVVNRGRGIFCTWECFKKYQGESSLEILVRQHLQKMNEPFQQEMKVGISRLRADFYLPKRNLVIECDGEYWHMAKKNILRDQRKDKLLTKLGYNIFRIRGQDIINGNFIIYLDYLNHGLVEFLVKHNAKTEN